MRCLHIKCLHCLHTERSVTAQIHNNNTCAHAISLRATENCALVRPSPNAGAATLDLSQIYIYTASCMPLLRMHNNIIQIKFAKVHSLLNYAHNCNVSSEKLHEVHKA